MFTGLVCALGVVRMVDQNPDGSDRADMRARIAADAAVATAPLGASIACDGVCLTVTETSPPGASDPWFGVDVSGETLSKTTLGDWAPGRCVNLERSLRVGDELGGHIVSGHVDGVGTLVSVDPDGGSVRLTFEAPVALARFIASKGSIAVDGASLTVNAVDGARFGVNVIPHTQSATTLGDRHVRDRVNLEIDVLARYVARLEDMRVEDRRAR